VSVVNPVRHRNRISVATTAAAGVVAVGIAWAAVGSEGPLSALLGAVLVLVFFSAGTVPFLIAGDGKDGRSGLAFAVLGMTIVLRVLIGIGAYQVASRSDAVDTTVVGLTIIGCALVWTNTQLVVGLQRRHQPTLDL
jgi:ATP synthase protein I